MSILRTSILCLSLLLLPFVAWGQEKDASDAGVTDSAPPPIPLLDQTSLAYSTELERSNYLVGGITLGTSFDDNAFNTNRNRVGNFAYSALPFIELDQSRSRLSWSLNYAGGFVFNQHLTQQNQASHNFGFAGQYRVTPHVTFMIREHFVKSSGFYDQVNQSADTQQAGLLQRPNQFVITPLAQQIGSQTDAQVRYQFAKDSVVGASGYFNLLNYQDVPPGTFLVDSESVGANAYYSHRLVGQNWLGIDYSYQKISFSPLPNNVLVHSIFLTDTFTITRNATLVLFAGPDHITNSTSLFGPDLTSATEQQLFHSKTWSVAGGGSFNWNGRRTSFLAQAARMVSDGGGVLGAVQLFSADVGVRRQWTQSLSLQADVLYGDNNPLSTSTSPYSSLRMLSANLSVSRELRNHLSLTAGYGRDLQREYQNFAASPHINHNRGWVRLGYQFSRPLGR